MSGDTCTINLPVLESYEGRLLLKAIAKGNEKAFRTLYDSYFHQLTGYIFKICKSEAVTEELVQEIFLKIWVNRADLAIVEEPEAYIFSMARNKTIDHLRRLAKETQLINILSLQIQEHNNDVEEKLNAAVLRQLIEEALQSLSDQKKKIFRLSKQDGLSHDEIAEVMQLSKSTVKNHLSETLQHIREHISKQPNPEALLLLWALASLN